MYPILPSAFEPGISRLRIRTIVRLRWIAVVGQTAAVLGVYFGLGFDLPIGLCLLIIALSAWLNVFMRFFYPPHKRMPNTTAAATLAYDVLQLSALLFLTGGLQNPFSFLIIPPVMISASTQPPRTTIALGAVAILCVTALAFFQEPLPWYPGEKLELPLVYVAGVWTALVSGALFFALYAWRIAKESRQMSDALAMTETALLNEQKISALDGLATAAAHELGTPLGTITVVTKEMLREVPEKSALREDVELLRSEAERCREILKSLTRSAGKEDPIFSHVPLSHLLEEVIEPRRSQDVSVHIGLRCTGSDEAEGGEPVAARSPGVIYGLGNLVENAVDFAAKEVTIEALWDKDAVTVTIVDDGPGFSAPVLERLGEPYLTSRPARGTEGKPEDDKFGLGLGFFIAKTLLERSGAGVEYDNRKPPQTGAIVKVAWPRDAIATAST